MIVGRKALGHDGTGEKVYGDIDCREVDYSRSDVRHFVRNDPAGSDGQGTFRMRYCFSTDSVTTARYNCELNGFGDVKLLQCPGGVNQAVKGKRLSGYATQCAIAGALKRVKRPKINNLIRQKI